VVGVAEAVQGVGLAPAVADLLVEGEGLLAAGEGLGLAEQGVVPADGVEGACQPRCEPAARNRSSAPADQTGYLRGSAFRAWGGNPLVLSIVVVVAQRRLDEG
jgi:hypothetical protein